MALKAMLPFPPVEIGRRQVSTHWCETRDGDAQAVELYRRHYSCKRPAEKLLGGNKSRFAGQGRPMVLIATDGRALFVWRKEAYRLDDQTGVCCSVFRNEGAVQSSLLIREAVRLAWERWPGERLFTFVNGPATRERRSRRHTAGWCFQVAGWTLLEERTKEHGYHILERLP